MSDEGKENTFMIFQLIMAIIDAFLRIFGSRLKPAEKQQIAMYMKNKSDSMMA